MNHDEENILDYLPEDYEGTDGFDKDDVIVLARVFSDRLETQMAASRLRVMKIPHYVADSNATLFTENVMGGERLFVRKKDLEIVAEELNQIKKAPYEGEEDWYKEVRTQQGYQPYRKMTYILIFAIPIFAVILFFFYYLGML